MPENESFGRKEPSFANESSSTSEPNKPNESKDLTDPKNINDLHERTGMAEYRKRQAAVLSAELGGGEIKRD